LSVYVPLYSENPWTGDIRWEKTSTLSSKPLNWQFTAGSTSYLMENGHCILRKKSDPESLRIEIPETDQLHKTFHCDKDKLTPTLVGSLSFSQNISNCKFVCLWSFIFCTILMLSNRIEITGKKKNTDKNKKQKTKNKKNKKICNHSQTIA
jgi:hypothetical protein